MPRFCSDSAMRVVTKPFPDASIPLMPTSKACCGESAFRFSMIAGITEPSSSMSCIRGRLSRPVLICARQSRCRTPRCFAVCQRDGVHTVAQSGWRRSVIEDMSEMRSTPRARNFHSEDRRERAAFVNRFFADRLPETRPAGARIEFRLRTVKRIAARRANVSAIVVIERVTAKGRQLRARSAHDVELLRRQYDQPFFVREIDFLVERNSVQLRPYLRYINIAGMRARAAGKYDAHAHA